MRGVKIVFVVVITSLMLVGATAFWTDLLRGPLVGLNLRDFRILLHDRYYWETVAVIVGIAGLLLWRWLTPRHNSV
jgi:hypothetical protein